MLLICATAAVLLFWGLGDKYLWQDEAATAVLSNRLMRTGKPLAYDGTNLITADALSREDIRLMEENSKSAKAAVEYYVKKGEIKSDTTWKWHPWGSFIIAGTSLKLFGQNTVAARLPFAVAGIVSVFLTFWLALRLCKSLPIAVGSGVLLVLNGYWILHDRQCRYYALTSLFLLITFWAYTRWQTGKRYGASLFCIAAWCWFQMDYGTVWPILAVLSVDALWNNRKQIAPVLVPLLILAASLAPFVYFYELFGRLAEALGHWPRRFFIFSMYLDY